MKKKDEHIDELLIDYALGQLDPTDKARVELMLAERPELMREARALKRMISHMGVSTIVPPPRLVSRTRHAAYQARAKRRGWRGIVPAALHRPLVPAAAGVVVLAIVAILVVPALLPSRPGDGPTHIGGPGTLGEELTSFMQSSLDDMRTLARGEDPAVDDPSERAGQAMFWQEQPLPTAQLEVLRDIETVWRTAYERAGPAGVLANETITELQHLVAQKRLVERIEALVRH
jgi:hypothetical protein